MTAAELELLRHACRTDRGAYNGRLVSCSEADQQVAEALVVAGLLVPLPSVSWIPGANYEITATGREAVLKHEPVRRVPTRSQRRYQRFLDLRDVYQDLTFAQFIRHERNF